MVGEGDGGQERPPKHQRGVAGEHQDTFRAVQAVDGPDGPHVGQGADPQEGEGDCADTGRDHGGQWRNALAADDRDPPGNHFAPPLDQAESEQGEADQDEGEAEDVHRAPPREAVVFVAQLLADAHRDTNRHRRAPHPRGQRGEHGQDGGLPRPARRWRGRRWRGSGEYMARGIARGRKSQSCSGIGLRRHGPVPPV
jgi:hypothetical protein